MLNSVEVRFSNVTIKLSPKYDVKKPLFRKLGVERMKTKLLTLALAASMTVGCQTLDPYTGEKKTSKATVGAVLGAVTGAAVGVATSSKKDRRKGALIGAVAGGAVGAGVGNYMDQQEAKLRQKLEGTGVRVVRNGNEITLIMPGNITFDTGRSDVKSHFYPTLESVGLVLKEFNKTIVEVAGHTDSTGSKATKPTPKSSARTKRWKFLGISGSCGKSSSNYWIRPGLPCCF